jgi:hypothetical protein
MAGSVAAYCAVLFRLFKKRREPNCDVHEINWFYGFTTAGTRVALRNKKLNSLADPNDRFAAVGRRLAWRRRTAQRAIPAKEN